jgi:uncharacterized membrane protein YfcA
MQALLAQYNALRAEISSRLQSQLTLILGSGTLISAIVGVIVAGQADAALLSIVPVVAGILGFVHNDNSRFINYAAKQLRDAVWPAMERAAGCERGTLPDWEHNVSRIAWNSDANLRALNLLVMPLAYGFFGIVPVACLVYFGIEDLSTAPAIAQATFGLGVAVSALYLIAAVEINRQYSWSLERLMGEGEEDGNSGERREHQHDDHREP